MKLQSFLKTGIWFPLVASIAVLLLSSVPESPPTARPEELHSAAGIFSIRPKVVAPQPPAGLLPIVDQPEMKQKHRVLADSVLRALPPLCRRSLKNFYVNYHHLDRRGYGGRTSIVLDGTVPDSEFVALLTHECGHVIHGNLSGTVGLAPSGFADGKQIFTSDSPVVRFFQISWMTENVLRKGAKDRDFVSGYGKTNAFEDFAEFLVAYVLHPDYVAARAQKNAAIKAKLAWMEKELPLDHSMIAESTATWNGTVPWDMTKVGVKMIAVSDKRVAVSTTYP